MRILVGISHPKHVYMFKNLIWIMKDQGHKFKVVVVDKEIAGALLDEFNIQYELIGKNQPTLLRKILNLSILEYRTLKIAIKFKPDVFIGQALPQFAHISLLLNKPFIVFEDTEHAHKIHKIVLPFADAVVTPECFRNNLGKKQVRFNGNFELAYLHPNNFQPDPGILQEFGLEKENRFILLRFISWEAVHDMGQSGLELETKRKLVKELEKYGRIFISSEKKLPLDLEKYSIHLSATQMHNFMYHAALFFGESATMASECAVMGVPSILIDFEGRGYTDEEENKYGLVFRFSTQKQDQERAIKKAIELLKKPDLRNEWLEKREKMLHDKMDVTKFMIDFIKKYDKMNMKNL